MSNIENLQNHSLCKLNGSFLNSSNNCFIIAEAGTSHQGNLENAFKIIKAVKKTGADCIKFQYIIANEIVHPRSGLISLPGGKTDLYKKFLQLERNIEFYSQLKTMAESEGLSFLCTPFGIRSARALQDLKVKLYKIASPEVNHLFLLQEIARYKLPVLLSCGVSLLSDIERALTILDNNIVTLLHCITQYPSPEEQYNLNILPHLSCLFGVSVGVSDHTLDVSLIPEIAVALGAVVIEKHFTLKQENGGLDDLIALEPDQFSYLGNQVREVEETRNRMDTIKAINIIEQKHGIDRVKAVLGTGEKLLAKAEETNYKTSNRSLLFIRDAEAGATLSENLVAPLRSEKNLKPGLSPFHWPTVKGHKINKMVKSGEALQWNHLI